MEKIQRRFLRMMAYKLDRVNVLQNILAVEFGLKIIDLLKVI